MKLSSDQSSLHLLCGPVPRKLEGTGCFENTTFVLRQIGADRTIHGQGVKDYLLGLLGGTVLKISFSRLVTNITTSAMPKRSVAFFGHF